jgi:hypothetical protein
MAEIRQFPQAGFPATRDNVVRKVAPADHTLPSVEKCCIYNQTRERFVATGVETVDASSGSSEARLHALEPGVGLWIQSCQGISATSIRFPVDVVCLNGEGVVLEAVESFPLGIPAISSAKTESVLVLPEGIVADGEIHFGDRLIVSSPEEMRRHFESLKDAPAMAEETPETYLEQFTIAPPKEPVTHEIFLEQFAISPAEEQSGMAAEEKAPDLLHTERVEPARAAAESARREPPAVAVPTPAPQPAVAPEPAAEEADSEAWKKRAEPKGWLARLLKKEPVDPRNSSRESLPGLIAYFFTGGTPVGHPVRDISARGMFILTEERWYPGTVVRITLTDRHKPTVERSITVNAKVVRSSDEGVGVEFVLEETSSGSNDAKRMERANGMDPFEVEEFLRIYKT